MPDQLPHRHEGHRCRAVGTRCGRLAEEQEEGALAVASAYALNAQDVVGLGGARSGGPDASALTWKRCGSDRTRDPLGACGPA
jgi:hypothetical protein